MSRPNNLRELLQRSSSTRTYFVSLPVEMQIRLHEQGEHIRSAEQLHRTAEIWQEQSRLS